MFVHLQSRTMDGLRVTINSDSRINEVFPDQTELNIHSNFVTPPPRIDRPPVPASLSKYTRNMYVSNFQGWVITTFLHLFVDWAHWCWRVVQVLGRRLELSVAQGWRFDPSFLQQTCWSILEREIEPQPASDAASSQYEAWFSRMTL